MEAKIVKIAIIKNNAIKYHACLVIPYINLANQAPGVQTGHTPGIYIELYIVEEPSKSFFAETIRPRANSM